MIARLFFLTGLLMLIWSAWFYIDPPTPPTYEQMHQYCIRDAHLNDTTPEDKRYMADCIEDWWMTVGLMPVFWLFVVLLGALITTISFWRIYRKRRKL